MTQFIRHLLVLLTCMASASPESLSHAAEPEDNQVRSVVRLSPGTSINPLIVRPNTVVLGHKKKSAIELTADEPAIVLNNSKSVSIEDLTIRWQLASSEQSTNVQTAILVKDTDVTFRNCRIEAIGNDARCPTALAVTGFSKVRVENCHFEGFNFTITTSGGAETTLTECTVRSAGHCGVSVYSASSLELDHCLVTGSKFHGVRCTGGRLDIHDSLIIGNKNRGIYLGNKPAEGRVVNNVIHSNGAGISSFGSSEVTIANNVFFANTYSGVDTRETCSLDVRDNIFAKNQHGFVLFSQGGANQFTLHNNNFWSNDVDVKDYKPGNPIVTMAPEFIDPEAGHFSTAGDTTRGLSPASATDLSDLWKRWEISSKQ